MESKRDIKHKNRVHFRTQSWGKTKFKPKKYVKPFVPPVPESSAKPWQHVKNDIIDDSEERGHQNVDTEDARKFMQQREQNHRRNIIEANRSEATKWESFEEAEEKPAPRELPTDVENFTAKDRNFYRRQLTKGISLTGKKGNLRSCITDLKRNPKQMLNIDGQAKGSNPFQKLRDNDKGRVQKKGKKANNPFNKKRNE
ncbi:uncharacterized protein [Drosophila takahashii]|uniref:uncharacterized protein n=1 Tax=Drosophila takahashii TaxID=29030 RepID=UPI001CF8E95D|nr:uncharacterized protein LOC108062491 [Drosophila takahashii]